MAISLAQIRGAIGHILFEPPLLAISERLPLLRDHCKGWRRTHPFDRENGVDTSGALAVSVLVGPDVGIDMNPYAGCVPSILRRTLATLPDLQTYTFVDLGCGKARSCVVASEFPFRHIIGVDLSERLARVARSNARSIRARYPDRTPIEIEVANAAVYPLPPGKRERVVYFLFNSFPASVMPSFVDHVTAALRSGTEHVFLIYYNPFSNEAVEASPTFTRWSAETLSVEPSELGFGPDADDTVVIWQSPALYPPRPGADRGIFTPPGTTQAELRDG